MLKPSVVVATLVGLAAAKVIAKIARLAFIKTTKINKNVLNVNWGNCSSMLKPSAVVATVVRLAAVTVIVQHARMDSTKIPKVKRNAVTFASHSKKYPTTKAPGVNCHHGARAKKRNT